jgi:hypothetical protein
VKHEAKHEANYEAHSTGCQQSAKTDGEESHIIDGEQLHSTGRQQSTKMDGEQSGQAVRSVRTGQEVRTGQVNSQNSQDRTGQDRHGTVTQHRQSAQMDGGQSHSAGSQ